MTNLRDNYWAVELPEGAKDIHSEVSMTGTPYLAYKFKDDELLNEYEAKNLPAGTWQIICTSNSILEDQAASIVQVISNGKISGRPQYRRYDRDGELPARMWTQDARHAFETLLASKGLTGNNYVILKKV
jgi:DNA/RNA endonuclease G (NUC1)